MLSQKFYVHELIEVTAKEEGECIALYRQNLVVGNDIANKCVEYMNKHSGVFLNSAFFFAQRSLVTT